MHNEIRVQVRSDADVMAARQQAKAMAVAVGFSSFEQAVIATALSELARNIVDHAGEGEIVLGTTDEAGRRGICIVARDDGPGIPDMELALRDGYSTSGGLGLGLPGVRRLMDEFEISSTVGKGTRVSVRKWAK